MKKQIRLGRPKKINNELKKQCSIRLMNTKKNDLINRYGSIQKAIDYFIKEDDKLWE